jgi:hypothetical protein
MQSSVVLNGLVKLRLNLAIWRPRRCLTNLGGRYGRSEIVQVDLPALLATCEEALRRLREGQTG